MNRASRTGPLAVTNEGTEFIALSELASATCGLGIGFCGLAKPGLLPPMAGWVWHIVQLFPLNVGPNPPLSSPKYVSRYGLYFLEPQKRLVKESLLASIQGG